MMRITLWSSSLFVALAACGSDALDDNSLDPTNPIGGEEQRRDAGADGGDVDAAVVPQHGLRSDWFDLFAIKKATRFDLAAWSHDAEAGPVPGIRGILYSARLSGRLTVPAAGELSLITRSDDGVRVLVDGETVIDNWNEHGPTEDIGIVTVDGGEHDLVVEYFQKRGAATFSLEWKPPGGARGAIPTDALKPLADAPTDEKGVELGGPRPTFTNPVVPFDCPDPGIMAAPTADHPRWVMVCTGGSMPVRVSDDLVSWSESGNAILPSGKAAWSANGGRNWAPEIHKVGSRWVAYYTAVNAANRLSIGCAHAASAEGPYTDCGKPLVEHELGVIDATFFEDTDGARYLYYKIDGNSVGARTPMYVRPLAADGLSFAPGSRAVEVLNNDPATWEGGVVEAPWVIKHDGFYYMFYSGNVYDHRYRMGVARATTPRGPFTKKGPPLLDNNARWVGPGHGTVVNVNGTDLYFHHAWPALPNGLHDGSKGRFGLIAPIRWKDGWPEIGNGSSIVDPITYP